VNNQKYQLILKDWFAFTLLEAIEVLPKVVTDPRNAARDMNRLKRNCDYQLQETIQIAEEEIV
jgi:hypothetical protein